MILENECWWIPATSSPVWSEENLKITYPDSSHSFFYSIWAKLKIKPEITGKDIHFFFCLNNRLIFATLTILWNLKTEYHLLLMLILVGQLMISWVQTLAQLQIWILQGPKLSIIQLKAQKLWAVQVNYLQSKRKIILWLLHLVVRQEEQVDL